MTISLPTSRRNRYWKKHRKVWVLAEVVDKAIKCGLTEEQQSAWYKHVAQLLKYALFSFAAEFDGVFDRGPEKVALWLSCF